MADAAQDDWQPVGGTGSPAGAGDDWQPVSHPQSAPQQDPIEQGIRQIGLGSRDFLTMATAVPAGIGDLANAGVNAVTGQINKYAGTNIPKLAPMSTAIQNDLDRTGLPKPENSVEKLGVDTSQLLGGVATGVENPMGVAKDLYNGAKGVAGKAADYLASKATPIHNPVQAAQDLTNSIFGNIENANKYYELPKAIAGNATAQAPEVASYLKNTIADIQSDPFHEARSMLPKLQRTLDTLPEDGSVPVSDLLDLRKTSNANFKPGRMTDKDGVYAGLNKAVNAGLDNARDTIPHFSDSLDVADDYWKNNVSNPITKNPVLQKVFDMEDAHNVRQFMNGQITDIPDATMQAANNMVSKIKDVDTYNAVRRLLPDESGKALDAAVLKNMSPSRWNAMVRTAKSAANLQPLNTVVNAADAIYPEATAQQKSLIKAVKQQNTYTPMATRNAAADAAFNSVKNSANQKPSMLALPPPSPRTVNVPPGGFKQTYSPTDLNAPDEVGFNGGEKYLAQKVAPETQEAGWLKNPYNYKKGGMVKKDYLAENDIKHSQWVGFVKKHGKNHGIVLKDKSDPKAVKLAAVLIKGGY